MEVLEKTFWAGNADAILVEKHLSKSSFAKELGVHPQNVGKWIETTNLNNLSKIANVLKVDLRYLIFGELEETASVSGYLEVNGEIHKIRSREDVQRLLETM